MPRLYKYVAFFTMFIYTHHCKGFDENLLSLIEYLFIFSCLLIGLQMELNTFQYPRLFFNILATLTPWAWISSIHQRHKHSYANVKDWSETKRKINRSQK